MLQSSDTNSDLLSAVGGSPACASDLMVTNETLIANNFKDSPNFISTQNGHWATTYHYAAFEVPAKVMISLDKS